MTSIQSPFQSIKHLGNLRSVHGYNNYFRNNRFILSGLILGGVFGCLCLVLYGLAEDARNGATSTSDTSPLFFVVMILCIVLFAAFFIFWLMRTWQRDRKYSAALFDNGFAIQDYNGKIETVVWADIQNIQAIRLKRGGFRNYDVICRDGRVIVLYYFLQNLSDLVRAVTQNAKIQG